VNFRDITAEEPEEKRRLEIQLRNRRRWKRWAPARYRGTTSTTSWCDLGYGDSRKTAEGT